jgi:DNA modification methylase
MALRVEKIGNATLYLGDCREILPGLERVDVCITDPPYEIVNKFGTSALNGTRVLQFHFDTPGVTHEVVLPGMSLALQRVSAFHCFCGFEQYAGIAALARLHGFTPKPWAKAKLCPPPPMPGNWWPSAFELAIYGYKRGAWFGDQDTKRKNLMTFDSYRNGIRKWEKADHPTQKWLPMVEYLMNSICAPSGTTLDPFMGSGTTGVAAVKLKRSFVGVEIDPRYFDIACRRIEEAQRQSVISRDAVA